MATRGEIPYLLSLIDDDEMEVRSNIQQELLSFGAELETYVAPYLKELSREQHDLLEELLKHLRRERFDKDWYQWLIIDDELQALEYAFDMLAYLDIGYSKPSLRNLLDELASGFKASERRCTPKNLMEFLFQEQGFSPPKGAYYHPSNSNLVLSILNRTGIQITLSCIAMLVGARCGVAIYGLNAPGYFLTFAIEGEYIQIYDCFRRGGQLARYHRPAPTEGIDMRAERMRAPTAAIIVRVLRNLMNAYTRNNDQRQLKIYHQIYDELIKALQVGKQ